MLFKNTYVLTVAVKAARIKASHHRVIRAMILNLYLPNLLIMHQVNQFLYIIQKILHDHRKIESAFFNWRFQ